MEICVTSGIGISGLISDENSPRGPYFLTRLDAKTCVQRRYDGVANRAFLGALNSSYHSREKVLLDKLRTTPRREETVLAVVAIICQMHLGPYEKNLAVEYDDSTVVPNIAVDHWHANVQQDSIEGFIGEDLEHHLPAMEIEVALEEVV